MFGDTWPPDWDKLAYHDFQYDQTFSVARIEMGESWAEFVENSQSYQAKVLKFSIEKYRQAKYQALGGLFQFMFMDCWPSITWSVVSAERIPKKGYYTLQQTFQPILIGLNMERETMLVGVDRGSHLRPLHLSPWVVNDTPHSFERCAYTVSLKGSRHILDFACDKQFDIPPDSMGLRPPKLTVSIPADTPPGQYQVVITLKQGDKVLSLNTYPLELVAAEK